jgi:hypothetical protein
MFYADSAAILRFHKKECEAISTLPLSSNPFSSYSKDSELGA